MPVPSKGGQSHATLQKIPALAVMSLLILYEQDKAIALLAEFWGFHREKGKKASTTSTGVELELVGILTNHKKSRRDPITTREGKPGVRHRVYCV